MTTRKKIIILDDNETFSALLAAALEDSFEIETGTNGLEGISHCLGGDISAIVSDIGMPEVDGLTMLRELRRNQKLASIPVIIITASHFNTISKKEVSRFPQVKRILSKDSGLELIVGQIFEVLGQEPP